MLMEELDGPLERLEVRVDTIFVSTISSNLLSAIAARLSRQEQQANEVHILELEVETEREAFETRIMMTSCTPLEFHLSTLIVPEIETEGWKLLASGLEAHTRIQQVHTKKSSLELGRREDLKLIWNAVEEGGRWEVGKPGRRSQGGRWRSEDKIRIKMMMTTAKLADKGSWQPTSVLKVGVSTCSSTRCGMLEH